MALAAFLAACSTSPGRAPVEERSPSGTTARPSAPPAVTARPGTGSPQAPGQMPPAAQGAPNAASSSPPASASTATTGAASSPSAPQTSATYTVRPGDTLIRIGLDHGQNWRDIARWSGLENPNLIEVGQVLRVSPPGQDPSGVSAATARPVASSGRMESRPLEPRPADGPAPAGAAAAPVREAAAAATPATAASGPAAGSAPGAAPAQAPAGGVASAPARPGEESVDWAWPAAGAVVAAFDEARGVKGLSIAGKAGDAVLAAADGRVVYAGSGLRGYGNLVIVKHNSTFLTAYAHNQTLLVKEDQAVRRGQKIAEMGSSDADRVKLHFEIRRLGRPVDPARLLPGR